MARESRRYLGLELSGAKNQKTALAALEFYPREGKTFLLDIYDRILPSQLEPASSLTGADHALLELIEELTEEHPGGSVLTGVNVPLELPPCIGCIRKSCSLPDKCSAGAVKWMREITRKAARGQSHAQRHAKVKEFTPYTQRPVELWLRYKVLPRLDAEVSEGLEIDETLGGNKAPLTARMHFLKRHLRGVELVEVWPKLSTAILAQEAGLGRRVIANYRKLEEGLQARETILEALADAHDIFIYDRDVRKLASSLSSFDAFICATTALLSDLGKCERPPTDFPVASGWIHYPRRERT